MSCFSIVNFWSGSFCFSGTSERKARHLYYSDLRERVLRSECRQQEEVYFQLAGYALQADLGDCPMQREGMEVAAYFEPKNYFPPWVGGTTCQKLLEPQSTCSLQSIHLNPCSHFHMVDKTLDIFFYDLAT